MTLVLAVNASRRGSGATHIAANLAFLLAEAGQRVGLVDADFQGPSQHFLFNVPTETVHGSVGDFLRGKSALQATAIDLRSGLTVARPLQERAGYGLSQIGVDSSRLFFVPSTTDLIHGSRMSLSDDDFGRLSSGIEALCSQLALDILIVDTVAGIGKETLLTLALCDLLLVVLTLDKRELRGAGITIEVAPKLNVTRTEIVINKAPVHYDRRSVRRQIVEGYGCEVAAILPYSDDIAALESRALFAQRYPNHAATWAMRRLARTIETEVSTFG